MTSHILERKCRPSKRFHFDIFSYSPYVEFHLLSDLFIVLFFFSVSFSSIESIIDTHVSTTSSIDVISVVVVVVSISVCSRVCDFTLENDCRRRRDYKRSIDLFCSCYFSGSSHIYFHDLSNVISAMKLIVSRQLFAVEPKDK